MLSNIECVGTNTGHEPDFSPDSIRGAGLNCDRIVLQQHNLPAVREYIRKSHARGTAIVGLLTRESFENPAKGYVTTYAQAMEKFLLNLITNDVALDYWQLWNEFDGTGYESNTAGIDAVNEMIEVCATAILNKDDTALLIAPSSVSGQANSYRGLRWEYFHYQAPHPYAKDVEDGNRMLTEYHEMWGKPFFITEFGWPNPDAIERGMYFHRMIEMFDDRGDVDGACWYCWSDVQHPQPFHLVNADNSYTKAIPLIQDLQVQNAAINVWNGQVNSQPEPTPPQHRNDFFVGAGVREIVDRHGLTVLGREDYFNTNCSLTPALPSSVMWVQSANKGLLIKNPEA